MGDNRAFKTELFSVAQILDEVRDGRVRVPLFQRGFVWNDDDRLQLFDSIQKGYPIGTLLLAKGSAPAGALRLGNYEMKVDDQQEALWVVDGQQRLSTLAMSLLGDFTGAHRPIFFDLKANAFVLGPRKRAPRASWVPSSVLGSSKTLNKWLRDANLGDEFSDRADAVAASLREYSIPAYVLPYRGDDDAVPMAVFTRINRRGRALTRQEVFDALHTDSAGMKPLERVDTSLARLGFGRPGVHIVERTAVALLGRAPGALPEVIGTAAEERALFDRVDAALARAVEFLAAEAGVPHSDWLPYDGALPTLARFFSRHPTPHVRNLELLARWFWRGTLTGHIATNNALDGHRWKAISDDEHRSVQSLLRLLPPVPEAHREWKVEPFSRGTARSKILLLALHALGPRMLLGEERGAEVQPATALADAREGAQAELPWLLEDRTGGERTLAHVLIHPKVPIDELRKVPWDQGLHETHAITDDAWASLVEGDIGEFVRRRGARLEAHVREFLDARLGFDRDDHDRPPLDAYLAEESA